MLPLCRAPRQQTKKSPQKKENGFGLAPLPYKKFVPIKKTGLNGTLGFSPTSSITSRERRQRLRGFVLGALSTLHRKSRRTFGGRTCRELCPPKPPKPASAGWTQWVIPNVLACSRIPVVDFPRMVVPQGLPTCCCQGCLLHPSCFLCPCSVCCSIWCCCSSCCPLAERLLDVLPLRRSHCWHR